jgi:hypothetical protein
MTGRPFGVRSVLGQIMAPTAAIVVIGSIALVVITGFARHARTELAATGNSVRLMEECRSDLRLLERAQDQHARRDIEKRLESRLVEVRQHVTTLREERALRDAVTMLAAQLASSRRPSVTVDETTSRREQTNRAFEDLIAITVDRAREEQKGAAWLTRVTSVLGVIVCVCAVALAGMLLWWLGDGTLRPSRWLARAVRRASLVRQGRNADARPPDAVPQHEA